MPGSDQTPPKDRDRLAQLELENKRLRAQLEGLPSCKQCGHLARSDARYCQCGANLIRTCYWCNNEIPVDQARCDICGWLDVGHGVLPEIESKWATFLALVHDKLLYIDNDEFRIHPFIELFHSVWHDRVNGPRFHARYEELLRRLKYDDTGSSYLFYEVFEKVGQPAIAFVVNMAMTDETNRAKAALRLLHDLSTGGDLYTNHPPEECRWAALRALLGLSTGKRVRAAVRESAIDSVVDVINRQKTSATDALEQLVEIAVSHDPNAASFAVTALERIRPRREYHTYMKQLKRAPDRTVASRAKAVLKRIRAADD